MNERIKLLAKQGGDYVNEVYTPPVISKTPGKIWEYGHVDWQTQFNEKFAELIVRQCALTAGLMEHEGRPNIGAQILDNFGVES